jgi:hypothetical protein
MIRMADSSSLPSAIDPVNVYRRTIFTRLIGPSVMLLSLPVLAIQAMSGSLFSGFTLFWLAAMLAGAFYAAAMWTDFYELNGTALVYHAPLARLVRRPVRTVFPLGESRGAVCGRRFSRVFRVEHGRQRLFIEGIDAFEEFVRRFEDSSRREIA